MADDRKRLQADIRRGIRSGLCEHQHKTVEKLVAEADDKLFTNVMYNKQHVLHSTLPGTMGTKYHLRPIPHNFMLTAKIDLSLNVILLPGCLLLIKAIYDLICSQTTGLLTQTTIAASNFNRRLCTGLVIDRDSG